MKLNIIITEHYSLVQSILDRLQAVCVQGSSSSSDEGLLLSGDYRINEYIKCVYLDNEDHDRWEYIFTNRKTKTSNWLAEAKELGEVCINDVDVEAYLEANRGQLGMTKLNLL